MTNMYWELIDTVSKIVTTYGAGILSRPQFWYVVTDIYPFASDYSLKATFKNCINSGYISNLIALKDSTHKTKSEIIRLIEYESIVNPTKAQEYAAVLYSIAIAIGSCSRTDYSDFITPKGSAHRPSPAINDIDSFNQTDDPDSITLTEPVHQLLPPIPVSPDTKGQCNFGVVISTVWGLITLLGSTLLYAPFLYDPQMGMSVIALTLGIFQFAFCSFTLNIFQNKYFKWNKATEETAIWCYMPIIIGFFINDLIPLLFCNGSIRNTIGLWLNNEAQNLDQVIEAPSGLSIFLIVVLLFCIFSCGWGLYYMNNTPTHVRFRKAPFLIVSAIIILAYIWLGSIIL